MWAWIVNMHAVLVHSQPLQYKPIVFSEERKKELWCFAREPQSYCWCRFDSREKWNFLTGLRVHWNKYINVQLALRKTRDGKARTGVHCAFGRSQSFFDRLLCDIRRIRTRSTQCDLPIRLSSNAGNFSYATMRAFDSLFRSIIHGSFHSRIQKKTVVWSHQIQPKMDILHVNIGYLYLIHFPFISGRTKLSCLRTSAYWINKISNIRILFMWCRCERRESNVNEMARATEKMKSIASSCLYSC